jgi:hypothetical protein
MVLIKKDKLEGEMPAWYHHSGAEKAALPKLSFVVLIKEHEGVGERVAIAYMLPEVFSKYSSRKRLVMLK